MCKRARLKHANDNQGRRGVIMALRNVLKRGTTSLTKLFVLQRSPKTLSTRNKNCYRLPCVRQASPWPVQRREKFVCSEILVEVSGPSLVTMANARRVNVARNIPVLRQNEHKEPSDVLRSYHRSMSNTNPGEKHRSRLWTFAVYFGGALLGTVLCVAVYIKRSLDRRGARLIYIPNMSFVQIVSPFVQFRGIICSKGLLGGIESAENFSVKKDDIFVVSFPRSGTTWTQEIVYLITNEADTGKARSGNLEERFPYLEDPDPRFIEALEASVSPRLIKSHLPYRMLPKEVKTEQPKIIYVMRNPKDVVVSNYHLWQKMKLSYRGSFEDFCELFLADLVQFSPWLDHVQEFWNRRHDDNILFIHYEDLIINLPGEVEKIAKFLDKPLSEAQLEAIVDHCSFDSMKQNDKVNYSWWDERGFTSNIGTSFMRKGTVGDWQNVFTPELNARMGGKVDKSLNDMGIDVKYVI